MLLNLPYSLPSFILKYQLNDEIVQTLKYNSKAYISCREILHIVQNKKTLYTTTWRWRKTLLAEQKRTTSIDKLKEKKYDPKERNNHLATSVSKNLKIQFTSQRMALFYGKQTSKSNSSFQAYNIHSYPKRKQSNGIYNRTVFPLDIIHIFLLLRQKGFFPLKMIYSFRNKAWSTYKNQQLSL